jgi:hypothetical protein
MDVIGHNYEGKNIKKPFIAQIVKRRVDDRFVLISGQQRQPFVDGGCEKKWNLVPNMIFSSSRKLKANV